GDQDEQRQTGALEFPRLRQPADQDDSARQLGRLGRLEGRVGSEESQGHQHARTRSDRSPDVSQWVLFGNLVPVGAGTAGFSAATSANFSGAAAGSSSSGTVFMLTR